MDEFIQKYQEDISRLISNLSRNDIQQFINNIKTAYDNKKHIFVIGNGGSAATAMHLSADLGKNAIKSGYHRFKTISLCDNTSYITAYGNDNGYENIFVEQLKNLIQPGDILIAISASGNSPNVIKAAQYSRDNNLKVLSLTGFKGGLLKEISDVSINVFSDSYEKIEDVHMVISHVIVNWFKTYYAELYK